MNKETKELPKLQPVPILITSYNRINLLKKTIENINKNTLYHYYLFVVDNNSTDGSKQYLKTAKVNGKIFDYLLLDENVGQSVAFNKLIEHVESWQNKRPMSDFIVFSNEDILTPLHRPKCWLEQMIDIFEKNEVEEGLGALSMRIQRMSRADIDESKDIIFWNKGIPAVYRLMRRSDLRQLGKEPMGRLLKWNGNTTAKKLQEQLKKRFGFTTHLFCDHIGFMIENKGFPEDSETFTVAANKKDEMLNKPYPDIDPLTNEPIKANHRCDEYEIEMIKKGKEPTVDPEVTILILTYKRVDGLKRMVDSVIKNTKKDLYDLLVMVDNDDTDSYNYCIENNIKCILSSSHRDFVAQANIGMYASTTPFIVKFDDDMSIPDDENWLERALELYKSKFPENNGLLAFNDGISHGAVWTTGIVSKKFIYEVGGHMYYPKYFHFGGDRETVRLAKHLGLYHYEDSIKINHFHPSQGTAEKDETYKLSENKFWRPDQKLKKIRQKEVDIVEVKNYCDYL